MNVTKIREKTPHLRVWSWFSAGEIALKPEMKFAPEKGICSTKGKESTLVPVIPL